MSEPAFLPRAVEILLAEIVTCSGAAVAAGTDLSQIISGAAPLAEAQAGELTYCDSPQESIFLEECRAAACFIAPNLAHRLPQATLALVMDEPYLGFAIAMLRLFPQETRRISSFGTAGINPGASIHPEARLEQDVIVDPGAVVGPRAEIGSGSMIGANSVIGPDVRIGRDCMIGPQVTIIRALIGNRVHLCPGVRIGQPGIPVRDADGAPSPAKIANVPSIGRVIIQDGVEIGANSAIDRGAVGDTVIGEDCKLGNLVQIGGNTTIGRYWTIPPQARISAGTRLGD
ncbi:MAG: UDP-3-O-(3-hydroxymyristoyl)glucosamine N-acyltransferase [Beijerinckiaceae bacterium]|nr:UDP-3-O-(3-hydroxymyristoyl)glucosamine N-acyltransferase [Beijerinckiaceae bacterium]